jgi:hypothetical protein
MTLTHDEAMEIVHGYDGFVAKQLESEHRWYNRYLIVFKDPRADNLDPGPGSLCGFYYDEPKTEEQEGMDTFDDEPVTVFRISSHAVVATVYERVDKS